MELSLAYVTGRQDPRLDLVIDGLEQQAQHDDDIQLIVVDALGRSAYDIGFRPADCITDLVETEPRPNIWQGKHRITSCDWWAMSCARNQGFICATEPFVAFLDDCCELGPQWLSVVRDAARAGDRVVCGSYEKHEDGKVTPDNRRAHAPNGQIRVGGNWLYGCTFCLPLEWALEVNGFEEGMDGLSFEDCIFGLNLANAGYRIDFDPRMFVKQHRGVARANTYRRTDKGVSPKDKSHAALDRFGKQRRTEFTPDLRELREVYASGEPFPIPDPDVDYRDWYDGELIRDIR